MRKVMLFCGLGMSTSLLVKKIQNEAEQRNLTNYEFFAVSASEYESRIKEEGLELCLVGPQVRYLLKNIKAIAEPRGIKVEVLDPTDYSNVNGKKVLDQIEKLLG